MVMTSTIAQVVAEWDMSDRMMWASECPSAEDEQACKLIEEIAESLGISEEDYEAYDTLSDMVWERWEKEYEEFCQPIGEEE